MKFLFFILFLLTFSFAKDVQILVETSTSDIDKNTIDMLTRDALLQNGDTPAEDSDTKLQIKVLPLGNAFIVAGELQESGEIKNSTSLKASAIEELDVVIPRVVQGTLNQESAKSNEEVEEITEKEKTAVKERKGVLRYTSFGVGPAFWHNTNTETSFAWNFFFGYIWEMNAFAAITLNTNMAMQFGDEWLYHETLLVGGRYYFFPTSVSPYIGGGLGIGFANSYDPDDEFVFGFAAGGSCGLVLFRTSELQLEIGATYDYVFKSNSAGKVGFHFGLNY